MLRIGLTGGIGCGKTTVADLFAVKGIPVVDADLVARELVEPGQPALSAIVARFGPDILSAGRLDRARLRQIVFADPEQRLWLESLLHPRVYEGMRQRIATLAAPYGILVIPLLLETQGRDFVDRVLVVDCPEDVQRGRVKTRDHLDEAAVDRILAAQLSRAARLAAADEVISNAADPDELAVQVDRLHRLYLALSQDSHEPDVLLTNGNDG
jgi:dephospho-CoA kinase